MPTPQIVYARVAQTLAGVDPTDQDAVSSFYEHLHDYDEKKRAIIADFIIGHEEEPDAESLRLLKATLDG